MEQNGFKETTLAHLRRLRDDASDVVDIIDNIGFGKQKEEKYTVLAIREKVSKINESIKAALNLLD